MQKRVNTFLHMKKAAAPKRAAAFCFISYYKSDTYRRFLLPHL